MSAGARGEKKPPEGDVPTRQLKTPERGKLCFEVIFTDYLGKWHTKRLINANFYNAAHQELEILKQAKFGKPESSKKKQGSDGLSNIPEIGEVAALSSDPKPSQNRRTRPNSGGKGERNVHTTECDTNKKSGKSSPKGSNTAKQPNQSSDTDPLRVNLAEQKQGYEIIELKNEIKRLNSLLREENEKYENLENDLNNRLADVTLQKTKLEQRHEMVVKQLQRAEESVADLTLRLSKLAGDNIRRGNPNLADLSDPYRPTELGKMFSEIYDNEWSDAFEDVEEKEIMKIEILHEIIMDSYKFCYHTLEDQRKTIDRCLSHPREHEDTDSGSATSVDTRPLKEVELQTAVQDVRKKLAPDTAKHLAEVYTNTALKRTLDPLLSEKISENLQRYARKCTELCWFMVICEPPLCFSDVKVGAKFDSNIFRAYTRSQKDLKNPVIEMTVWPAMYLHHGGSLLSKGVAQPISGTELHSKKK